MEKNRKIMKKKLKAMLWVPTGLAGILGIALAINLIAGFLAVPTFLATVVAMVFISASLTAAYFLVESDHISDWVSSRLSIESERGSSYGEVGSDEDLGASPTPAKPKSSLIKHSKIALYGLLSSLFVGLVIGSGYAGLVAGSVIQASPEIALAFISSLVLLQSAAWMISRSVFMASAKHERSVDLLGRFPAHDRKHNTTSPSMRLPPHYVAASGSMKLDSLEKLPSPHQDSYTYKRYTTNNNGNTVYVEYDSTGHRTSFFYKVDGYTLESLPGDFDVKHTLDMLSDENNLTIGEVRQKFPRTTVTPPAV